MTAQATAALLLIGAPGSGKSSVLERLGTLLETEGTVHGLIESEALMLGWPQLPTADWIPPLAAVVAFQRRTGRNLLLIAGTPETLDDLDDLIRAASSDRVFVVCLTAPSDVVASRISDREPDSWPGKAALVTHARDLAETIPLMAGIDVVMSTASRPVTEVAAELHALISRTFVLQ